MTGDVVISILIIGKRNRSLLARSANERMAALVGSWHSKSRTPAHQMCAYVFPPVDGLRWKRPGKRASRCFVFRAPSSRKGAAASLLKLHTHCEAKTLSAKSGEPFAAAARSLELATSSMRVRSPSASVRT